MIEPETKLGGIVAVDETLVGGKAKNRHWAKRDGKPGPTASGKAIVAGEPMPLKLLRKVARPFAI
jgi:hypothetical protein